MEYTKIPRESYTPGEGVNVRWLFTDVINERGYKDLVEIGVFQGKFSRYLLLHTNDTHLSCVDPWAEGYMHKSGNQIPGENVYQFACRRLKGFGDRVDMLRMPSLEGAKTFEDSSLDFVFIDGDHSYQAVIDDILAWWPKVRPGGVLAGHDYGILTRRKHAAMKIVKQEVANVHKAVHTLFDEVGEVVERPGFTRSWWVTKNPC